MENRPIYDAAHIVVGAGGTLGRSFVSRLSEDQTACVIAASRHAPAEQKGNVFWYTTDEKHFLKSNTEERAFLADNIHYPVTSDLFVRDRPVEVTLVYPVGPFEFDASSPNPERITYSQINPVLFGANVVGLRNFVSATSRHIEEWQLDCRLRIICFGSVSNRFKPLFWQSYALSKEILSRYLMTISSSSNARHPISALMVNTSTIETGAENCLRPKARDERKALWLPSSKVVHAVLAKLQSHPFRAGYEEMVIDIPYRAETDYNSPGTFDRWQRAMGLEG